jgi:hypothetical protein
VRRTLLIYCTRLHITETTTCVKALRIYINLSSLTSCEAIPPIVDTNNNDGGTEFLAVAKEAGTKLRGWVAVDRGGRGGLLI